MGGFVTERALGKRPPRHDPRTLRLTRYLTARAYPAPPPLRDWIDHSHAFDLLGNDRIGDCAFAAQAHLLQCFAAANDAACYVGKADVLDAYTAVTGYSPIDPATDRGTVLLDALSYWRNTGLAGHTIGAYVKVEVTNRLEVEAAINLFGGLYAGVALPLAAKKQTIWDVAPPAGYTSDFIPNSWGGHAIAVPSYSRTNLVCVTWGHLKVMTWEWLQTYADELYAVISSDWVKNQAPAPNGFDLELLKADLAAVGT